MCARVIPMRQVGGPVFGVALHLRCQRHSGGYVIGSDDDCGFNMADMYGLGDDRTAFDDNELVFRRFLAELVVGAHLLKRVHDVPPPPLYFIPYTLP